jgi:hypothetical protein
MMLLTDRDSMANNSPLIKPSYPRRMPKGCSPWYKAVRTAARMQAFIPGESPPEVKMPMFFTAEI